MTRLPDSAEESVLFLDRPRGLKMHRSVLLMVESAEKIGKSKLRSRDLFLTEKHIAPS